ncbi:MAG: hypothetical protein LRY68_10490 [Sulfurospirillum sp.]|nr:hypothetical protein [Sulfurospirillum sp.]
METLTSLLPIVVATALAFWAYRLGEKVKEATQRPFEEIEFAGKRYWGVDLEEQHLGTRVIALLKQIRGHQEGVVLDKNEPIVALVPMEEFLRLKGLEEYLDDIAIAKIIETRLANRDRTQSHPLRDFDGFREILYKEEEEDTKETPSKKDANDTH